MTFTVQADDSTINPYTLHSVGIPQTELVPDVVERINTIIHSASKQYVQGLINEAGAPVDDETRFIWDTLFEDVPVHSSAYARTFNIDHMRTLNPRDIAHAYDCPFRLYAPYAAADVDAKRYTANNNIPEHFYQIIGTKIHEERFSSYWLGKEKPDWTRIRDRVIQLNVNNISVAYSTAEDVLCAWTDEVLVIDASQPVKEPRMACAGIGPDGQIIMTSVQASVPPLLGSYGTHNSITLEEIMAIMDTQEDALIASLLRDLEPQAAMRFMALQPSEKVVGLRRAAPPGAAAKDLYTGLPEWLVRAKYYTEHLDKRLPRNWRHIVIVGAAKKIGTGEFKPSRLYQWLANMGRVNCVVFFLD